MISRREPGFTLVELLVVLAIIGLSLAIAAPFLASHVTGASLNSAAGEIRAAQNGLAQHGPSQDRAVQNGGT